MSVEVSVISVLVGNGAIDRWRDITPPRPRRDEDHVLISFGVNGVRGDLRTTLSTIEVVLQGLQQTGHIKHAHMSMLGLLPDVICQPGDDVIRSILASGKADNSFVTDLQIEFERLLNEVSTSK